MNLQLSQTTPAIEVFLLPFQRAIERAKQSTHCETAALPATCCQRLLSSRFCAAEAEQLEHDLKLVPAPSKGSGWLANTTGMD